MGEDNFYNGTVDCPYCGEPREVGEPKDTEIAKVTENDIQSHYKHHRSFDCNSCNDEYHVYYSDS